MLLVEVAVASCTVPRFNFWLGNPASASMAADSGVPCSINVWQGPGGEFKTVFTAKGPAHGAVRAKGPRTMVYRSRPGYRGADSFVIAIRGTKLGAAAATDLTVNVTVTPSAPGEVAKTAWPAATREAKRTPAQPTQSARLPGRSRAAGVSAERRATCDQQAGAGIDPVTKRLTVYATERDAMARLDAYRMCLAGGDRAKANTIPVRERHMNPGGGPPSRY